MCKNALHCIVEHAEEYENLAIITKGEIGSGFTNIVNTLNVDEAQINKIFQLVAYFIKEVSFRREGMVKEESDVLDYFSFENKDLTSDEIRTREVLTFVIPKNIIHETFSRINNVKNEIEISVTNWSKLLSSWEDKVSKHEENLKKYHTNYNFVGLSKAFSEMYKRKSTEKIVHLVYTVLLGIFILLPLVAQFIDVHFINFLQLINSDDPSIINDAHLWGKAGALLALEIILLYFFRIGLQNYQSAKFQLLQLDMRQSLCAFIESYAEFSSSKSGLENFQSLIFSQISPDSTKIPGTFDGIEQLAKLIKEIKK